MSRPTHVYIVTSPRPRVGRTLVARAFTEFYRADGRPVAAFDLNRDAVALADFLPKFATRAQIADTRGQMALFDQLIVDDEKPKVVDLGASLFEPFFTVMSDIGFVAEARASSVEPVILFVATPEQETAQAYADLHRRFPDVTIVPVHNEGIARGSHIREKFPSWSAVALPLQVPQLSPSLRFIIETKPFSFSDFKRGLSAYVPEILEAELNSWIKRVYLQFRELELRLLLDRLRSSLDGARARAAGFVLRELAALQRTGRQAEQRIGRTDTDQGRHDRNDPDPADPVPAGRRKSDRDRIGDQHNPDHQPRHAIHQSHVRRHTTLHCDCGITRLFGRRDAHARHLRRRRPEIAVDVASGFLPPRPAPFERDQNDDENRRQRQRALPVGNRRSDR